MKKSTRKKAGSTQVKSAPARSKPNKKAATDKPRTGKSSAAKSLKKQYLKTTPVCKVTFRLPKEAAPEANMVTVVGDFNNWSITENKMKKLKSGDFTLTLELPCNGEYKFRYLIDADRWENDWFADKYLPNRFGDDDSVVVINGNQS